MVKDSTRLISVAAENWLRSLMRRLRAQLAIPKPSGRNSKTFPTTSSILFGAEESHRHRGCRRRATAGPEKKNW